MATRDGIARQREAFGGVNIGAAFFGWLVAVGLGALLTALLAAAGAAVALEEIDPELGLEDDEVGAGGAIGLVVIALISYFAGGYVAGRMSRFDGAKQGLGVWLWAIVMAIVFAIIAWLADSEWNLYADLDLPRIPADETLTALGIAVLVIVALATLGAAIAGGLLGVRYHRRVDSAAVTPSRADEPRA